MNIDKTIRDYMKESIQEVFLENKAEQINNILFANICIERFLEKLGEKDK